MTRARCGILEAGPTETGAGHARTGGGLQDLVGAGVMVEQPSVRLAEFDAFLFDLDGVVTRTADVHARCWKRLFDEFLLERQKSSGGPFVPFEMTDYRVYVDGKPRGDGVRSFLASRNISLPEGDEGDPPGAQTIAGLAALKDAYFQEELAKSGVEVYASTVAVIRRLRSAGLRTAIVSSSRNCKQIVEAAGLTADFDARVDGTDLLQLGMRGKPDPAIFLEAARRLGVGPERTAVVEDASSGVEAGRAGGFKLVIGINREGTAGALKDQGADMEVRDLAEIALL